MMYIFLLVFLPILFSFMFLLPKKNKNIKILSFLFFLLASTFSILLALKGENNIIFSDYYSQIIEYIIVIFEIMILVFIYIVSFKNKKWGTLFLNIIQSFLTFYILFFSKNKSLIILNIDKLSLVMSLVINIVGSLILVFSNEYIVEYQKHKGMKDRRKLYYFVICIFLSAMNGLIFSDSFSILYFFWEITTICSFILISYNNDKEAKNSGFLALFLNMLGGICFSIGIIIFKDNLNINTLSDIINNNTSVAFYTLPVFLLCIAGFAKSAQMPFNSWLLGAMVAPTPVSALLHSSTMVKAGVYLIVKLSPAYAKTPLGSAIAIFGSISFLICSILAFTQRNAKRVLAYSTISNLGLIIASAGMGSSIAISAAIMLIIFHSVSKALLFLCTGQIEHVVGSRDIEDMAALIKKAPLLTVLSVFGMLSMIIPPFGVLITKWISIEASATNPIVAIFLILGSAFTTAFYVKWIGTMLAYPVSELEPRRNVTFITYFPLCMLSLLILLTSIFITQIFNIFVSPEVIKLLSSINQLKSENGQVYSKLGSFNLSIIFLVIVAIIIIVFFIRKILLSPRLTNVYLCGENISETNVHLRFRDGLGTPQKPIIANLYLYHLIDEKRLTIIGYAISIIIILYELAGGAI